MSSRAKLGDELREIEAWAHNARLTAQELEEDEYRSEFVIRLAKIQRDAKTLLDMCGVSPMQATTSKRD